MKRNISRGRTEKPRKKGYGTIPVGLVLTVLLLGSSLYLAQTFFKQRRLRKALLLPIPDGPVASPLEKPTSTPAALPPEEPVLINAVAPVREEQAGEQMSAAAVLSSLYEKSLDPPEYEQERLLYPHVKLFPLQQDELLCKDRLPYDWRLVGASRRGYGHSYEGKYREDDFAILTQYFTSSSALSSDVIAETPLSAALVAIADGVGSKRYARYGAHAAVEGAISALSRSSSAQKNLEDLATSLLTSLETAEMVVPPGARDLACTFLCQAMAQAQIAVQEAAQRQDVPATELHSTLLLLLIIPLSEDSLFLASTQIGDGALFARQRGKGKNFSDDWHCLQHAQIQVIGNSVVPLLDSNQEVWQHFFQCGIYKDLLAVLGMTDGTADDIEPPLPTLQSPEPDPFVFVEDFYTYVHEALRSPSSREAAVALNEFLGYRKPQSYDDRTVLCLYRKK